MKKFSVILFSIFLVLFVSVYLHHYYIFARDFTGFSKKEIINLMGEPYYTSGIELNEEGLEEQTIGYYHPYYPGLLISLTLKNNFVVSHYRSSK